MDSSEFRSLPYDIQHELLIELKEKEKKNSWKTIHKLPSAAEDFCSFQMNRLRKKSKINDRIENVRDELNKQGSAVVEKYGKNQFLSSRIVSEDDAHVYLVKGLKSKPEEKKKEEKIDYTNVDVFEMAKKHMEKRRMALEKIDEEDSQKTEISIEKKFDNLVGNLEVSKKDSIFIPNEEEKVEKKSAENLSSMKDSAKDENMLKAAIEISKEDTLRFKTDSVRNSEKKEKREDVTQTEDVEEKGIKLLEKKEAVDSHVTNPFQSKQDIIKQETCVVNSSKESSKIARNIDSESKKKVSGTDEIKEIILTDEKKKMMDLKEMDVDVNITESLRSISSGTI